MVVEHAPDSQVVRALLRMSGHREQPALVLPAQKLQRHLPAGLHGLHLRARQPGLNNQRSCGSKRREQSEILGRSECDVCLLCVRQGVQRKLASEGTLDARIEGWRGLWLLCGDAPPVTQAILNARPRHTQENRNANMPASVE